MSRILCGFFYCLLSTYGVDCLPMDTNDQTWAAADKAIEVLAVLTLLLVAVGVIR